jgi:predicted  nucleic acid-binding Zn-ribbon protein
LYGLALVVVLVIMGGLIAYAGDRIGMKVGRRRLSIFGLRPKYTSIIVAVMTGTVIAASTLIVLTLVSQDVRTALFKSREIQEALVAARADLDARRAEAEALARQVEEAALQYSTLKSEFDEVNVELSKAFEERIRAEADLAELEETLRASQQQLHEVEARYKTAQADLAGANVKLKTAQSEIDGLSREKSNLERHIANLNETRDRLQAEVARLERKVVDLTETSVRLMEARQSSMLGQVIFPADQVILGSVIDCSQRAEAVRNQVNGFLLKVNEIAVNRGARSDNPDGDPFVLNFDESNVLAAFQRIDESDGKVILRAVSPVNSWYGEPLWVSLHVLPDQMIYFSGQVIASRTIDGSAGSEKVQEQLLALMQDVNTAAISKGMASDEEGKIGTVMTVSEFAAAIMDIVQVRAKVMVEAVAERDIWRSHKSPPIRLVIRPI